MGGGVAYYQHMLFNAANAAPESRDLRELSSQQFQVEVEVDWRLHAGMEGDEQLQVEMEGARLLLS